MALMRSSTACLAPSPIASIAMTEATPITMPSSVSTVRNRLARNARTAGLRRFERIPTARARMLGACARSVRGRAHGTAAGPGSSHDVAVA